MDFDVFDKLSELETKVYVLEAELKEKDATIQSLLAKIKELDEIAGNSLTKADLKSDLCSLENGKSIADVLKETSESALQCTGYTFDQRTGLYFDTNSGYYYDPKNKLFYEPKSNTYYRYNAETREYTHQKSVDKRLAAQFKHVTNQIHQSGENNQVQKDSPSEPIRDSSRSPSRNRRRRRRRHWSRDGCRSTSRNRGSHRRNRSTSYSPSSVKRSRARRSHGRKRIRSVSTSSTEESVYRTRSLGNRNRHRSLSADLEDFTDPSKDDRSDSSDGSHTRAKSASLAAKPVVYPPVVRLMLLASQYVPVGTVFIVTSEESSKGWACIGSSTAMCPTVNFPGDPAVDPIHCEIVYDEDDQRYALMDRDSESGTYLNGRILAKQAQIILHHGDVIRVGTSRLLVHIHAGCDSCGQCDPEVVRLAMEAAQVPSVTRTTDTEHGNTDEAMELVAFGEEESTISAAEIRELERRATLDQLKEKYGLKHRVPLHNTPKTTYFDRAAQRRAIESNLRAAGYVSPERAKRIPLIAREVPTVVLTQSSTSVPLAAENRGAKLLSKMGWNPGQGLGKDNRGISEPICVTRRINPLAGLGSSENAAHGSNSIALEATPREIQHARQLAITRERYERSA